ncbi:hypothetical protein NBY09_09900 [Elizabethkingia anophelis]|uniref:hypothetical protein n=1 Tax=Elizabethkingia anophelis TaxID=1117645 RepID=UPI00234FB664|nr:hypothetical protein [Elizabethkingia anophelis]MDC8026470.1 hypothetical protein [Elizabethkingia anophelis]
MKKLISTLFLFIGLLAFAQAGIKFDDGNFSSLLAKAKKENKLIFWTLMPAGVVHVN